MLNDLFGKVVGLEEEVRLGLELQSNLVEAFENGFASWQDVEETGEKCKIDKADLKSACHDFFREVIWTAEQSNLTLAEELGEDEELSKQWGRVEEVVIDTFSRQTLWEMCCK